MPVSGRHASRSGRASSKALPIGRVCVRAGPQLVVSATKWVRARRLIPLRPADLYVVDDRAPRSTDASLRDHRDWQRELALQEPLLTEPITLRPARPGGPTGTSHARAAASRVVGASSRTRVPPMDYLDNLHRASQEGSILHADRGSKFNAD